MSLPARTQRWLLFAGVFMGAATTGSLSTFLVQRAGGTDRVLWGAEGAGIALAGLDRAGIESALEGRARELASSRVQLELEGRSFDTRLGQLGVGLDVDALARAALSHGRGRGIGGELRAFVSAFGSRTQLRPAVAVDRATLAKVLGPWAQSRLQVSRPPHLAYQDGLRVDEGARGVELDYLALERSLTERARQMLALASPASDVSSHPSLTIQLPVVERAHVVPLNVVAQRREQAEALLAGPMTFLSETGARISLTPRALGSVLSSHVDEQARDLVLDLDLGQLRKRLRDFLSGLERPAQNARFDFKNAVAPRIVPSATGLVLDETSFVDRIWHASSTPERQLIVPLMAVAPKLSTEMALGLNIQGLVSSFVTRHVCCQPRVDNIHLAADKLDQTVLLPGEKFSLNALLGLRNAAAGYKSAPTIIRGEMEDVFGGGISQLATTLFNAILRGGYKIVQRQPHSVYFSRYPEGHEATVSYPEPDLIFENDTSHAMLITTEYSGTFIKVLVYGDNEGRSVAVGKGPRTDIVPPPVEYEANDGLNPEESKRLRAGQMGWKVQVWRTIKYPDGHTAEEKREVVYQPRAEIVAVHSCKIPEGDKAYTGERCPAPDEIKAVDREEELSDDVYFETSQLGYEEEGG